MNTAAIDAATNTTHVANICKWLLNVLKCRDTLLRLRHFNSKNQLSAGGARAGSDSGAGGAFFLKSIAKSAFDFEALEAAAVAEVEEAAAAESPAPSVLSEANADSVPCFRIALGTSSLIRPCDRGAVCLMRPSRPAFRLAIFCPLTSFCFFIAPSISDFAMSIVRPSRFRACRRHTSYAVAVARAVDRRRSTCSSSASAMSIYFASSNST
jgi:hypothetical protein